MEHIIKLTVDKDDLSLLNRVTMIGGGIRALEHSWRGEVCDVTITCRSAVSVVNVTEAINHVLPANEFFDFLADMERRLKKLEEAANAA